ncbi:hypothetical protein [Flavobacterium orientale]|uniref:hypothetical protein n=1 Tax=Flavobacterium orientale TaxID=1756020 RepID=UPI00166426E3|nr:hypothetical protein [Flavobacterium orientale]
MLHELARVTLIAFGIFFILTGGLMLFKPNTARAILRKVGSTNFINYAEITIRMIPAVAFLIVAEQVQYTTFFKLAGWFMLLTSFVLYFVPRTLHHAFSNRCADFLKPVYFQMIAPFSMLIGGLLLCSVL